MRRAPPFPQSPDFDDDESRPSKTALKRQSHDLQALGQALIDLPASRQAALDLPESLRDALAEYNRTRSHEGRRRQLQYIGKLMRKVDEAPIREAVAAYKLGSAKETLKLHEAEYWRDKLLASDDALTEWINAHPGSDPQALRSLVRSARKDAATPAEPGGDKRHGRAYRELFQIIKAGLAEAADDVPDTLDEDAYDD